MLVVIPKWNSKTIHFYAESLLEQFFGTDNFVSHPLLVSCAGQLRSRFLSALPRDRDRMPFTQVLVCGRVRLNVDAVVTHIGELFPRNRLSTAETATGNAFCVEEHGQGVAEFL